MHAACQRAARLRHAWRILVNRATAAAQSSSLSYDGASRRSYDVSLAVPIFYDDCFVTHKDFGVSDCCLSTTNRHFVPSKRPLDRPVHISLLDGGGVFSDAHGTTFTYRDAQQSVGQRPHCRCLAIVCVCRHERHHLH